MKIKTALLIIAFFHSAFVFAGGGGSSVPTKDDIAKFEFLMKAANQQATFRLEKDSHRGLAENCPNLVRVRYVAQKNGFMLEDIERNQDIHNLQTYRGPKVVQTNKDKDLIIERVAQRDLVASTNWWSRGNPTELRLIEKNLFEFDTGIAPLSDQMLKFFPGNFKEKLSPLVKKWQNVNSQKGYYRRCTFARE